MGGFGRVMWYWWYGELYTNRRITEEEQQRNINTSEQLLKMNMKINTNKMKVTGVGDSRNM